MAKRIYIIANMLIMQAILSAPILAQGTTSGGGTTAWQHIEQTVLIPWVTFVILALGMTLLILDLLTIKTWGLMGTAGLACVAIVFTSYISADVAGWTGIAMFVIGQCLLLMEAHVLPGHLLGGIGGIVCLFVGMFLALGGMAVNPLFAALTSAFFTLMSVAAFLIYLPKTSAWRRLGQKLDMTVGKCIVSTEDAREYVGSTGKAITALKPSGTAEFNGRRLEVVSESGYIPPDHEICAVRLESDRLIVRDAALEAERSRRITLGE